MKTRNSKDPVRLRERLLKNGNVSLYFDIYINGKRSYEFLNLYLVPEKTRADKEKNKETLRLADAIRASRIVELQNGRFGFNSNKSDVNFLEYFRSIYEKHKQNKDSLSWLNWSAVLRHLEIYCHPDTTFKDITIEFAQGFKDYLDNVTQIRHFKEKDKHLKLSTITKHNYFCKLKTCISQAVKDGIIPQDPILNIKNYKKEERERAYLTLEEVKAMVAIQEECKFPNLRRAFLFSCLTGLRKCDIEKMTWSEVRQQGEFTRIVFKQKKTGGQEYTDINPQAVEFMGKRGNPDDLVFDGFHFSTFYTHELRRWAQLAGITKKITFHSARHTFAVMMLDLGADIYTVQKLLGHKSLNTTQVYAKVMDKKKQEAAMLIPQILPTKTDKE